MKTCPQCQSPFEITEEDRKFYEKFGVEPTGLCFECDQKSRLCFRNERMLYIRKCDFSGAEIISIYSPDKPYKVYKNDIWNSDQWNALDYGRDFDFSRPFFEQYRELQTAVPRSSIVNINSENSDYCNMCISNKNCYLVFGGDYNQDVMFGTLCMHNINSVDIDLSSKNELCYFLGDSNGCYGSRFTFDSKNCKNCCFVSDCSNCSDCIMCINLSNKAFCILNKQYSKDEYLQKRYELLNGSCKSQNMMWNRFQDLLKTRIVKHSYMMNCQNCTGDYIKNSRNCHSSYDISNSEDVTDCLMAVKAFDAFQSNHIGHDSEMLYQSMCIVGSKYVKFSYYIADSSDIEYSEQMLNSHNCFGCNGLDRQEFCILNKKYSKAEYEKLREKIIEHMKKTGEWGKYFPGDLSCFGYNESTVYQNYPLTKEQVLTQGFKWKDEDYKDYKPQAYQIPDNIRDAADGILQEILACEDCKKNYKIVEQELKFYRKNNIPVPRRCSECRHRMRLDLRNPRRLHDRQCAKCQKPIQTTYAPDRPEIVYCENCYLKNVY